MTATREITAGQALKLAQQFVDQKPSTETAQAILASGVLKSLCLGDYSKLDLHKVERALGLFPDFYVGFPHKDELKKWRPRQSPFAVPYDIDLLYQPGKNAGNECAMSVVKIPSRDLRMNKDYLSQLGYRIANVTELLAFGFRSNIEILERSHPSLEVAPFVYIASGETPQRDRWERESDKVYVLSFSKEEKGVGLSSDAHCRFVLGVRV